MVRWSHVAWLCLFVGVGVPACNKTCVDDGLHANQDPAACMAATTTATSTSATEAMYATSATSYGTTTTTTTTTGDSDSDSDGTTLGLTSAPDTSTSTTTATTTDTTTGTTDTMTSGDGNVPETCDDGLLNQDESDIDCGGVCKPCPLGDDCNIETDCEDPYSCHPMGVCVEPLCNNGVFDQGIEAHVDCGSSCGSLCGLGIPCDGPPDCAPGLGCYGGHCAMNGQCGDSEQTADETDIDCGGPLCGPSCRQFQMCDVGGDCISNSCIDSVCDDPLCQDDLQDHGETDVDCGGPCDPCFGGLKCVADSDCYSLKCNFFICG